METKEKPVVVESTTVAAKRRVNLETKELGISVARWPMGGLEGGKSEGSGELHTPFSVPTSLPKGLAHFDWWPSEGPSPTSAEILEEGLGPFFRIQDPLKAGVSPPHWPVPIPSNTWGFTTTLARSHTIQIIQYHSIPGVSPTHCTARPSKSFKSSFGLHLA